MKKRSRLIVVVILVVTSFLIAFKLKTNRQEYKEEIVLAQKDVDKIAVTTERINTGKINKDIVFTGTLEASEVLTVLSETQGKIIKIYKKKGDRIKAGDVIAKVDDDVIAANVLTAEANYSQFERDMERLKRLSEENAVTKRDLEQTSIGMKKAKADLITARKALSNTSIKAPISGYINNDYITQGQFLGGGSPVCEIVNNSSLKINIKITENEVYKVKAGQTVTIHLSAFPDKKFIGKITSVAEKADMAMKFNVEITLKNDANTHLRSGLYAEVELPIRNDEMLLIRKEAIIGSMEKPVVFIAKNGKAERHEIVIGQSNDSYVEAYSGLSNGDELIVSGQLNLKNGDDIKVVN